MRKYFKLFTAAIALLLCASLAACNHGSNNGLDIFDNPGDALGGGGSGVIENDTDTSTVIDSITDVTDKINISDFQETTTYDSETAISIVLGNLSQTVVVTEDATYVVSGTLAIGHLMFINGDDVDHQIHIVLNGVDITSLETAPLAVFDGLNVVITLESSTVNTLTDGTTHSLYYKKSGKVSTSIDDDKVSSCLYVQNDLTINGTGTLNVTGNYKNAIHAKDNITILSGIVNATCNADGTAIKGKENVAIMGGNITAISKIGDGIKSDVEADTTTSGTVYIANATINVDAKDDGIVADTLLVIDSGNITIKTNNGAPTTISQITEYSSDNADGKGLKVGTIEYEDDLGGVQEITDVNYYRLMINGGTININVNDDAIHSSGYLYVNGGTITIATGDDGIHAEEYLKIADGTINIDRCYEGIEAAQITISGGDITLTASDDGINAANGDYPTSYNFKMIITGGDIAVNAAGDGVDSNGSINMSGGTLYIDGPTNSGNGALDSERGVVITGGTLVAVGALGMVETPATNSTQNVVSYAVNSSITANTTISLRDSSGNVLVQFTTAKSCQSVIISSADLQTNQKYSLYIGSTLATEFTVTSVITKIGTQTGGGSMGGGGGWGMGGNKRP